MASPDEVFRRLVSNPRDSTLWSELDELVRPRLLLFTYSLLRGSSRVSSEEALDVVQDVMLRFVKDFNRLKSRIGSFPHLENYLIKACRNTVANRFRHAAVREGARQLLQLRFSDLLPESFAEAARHAENRQMVSELAARLGPTCQKLVRAYLLEDVTLADFADAEGLPAGTVYSQWHRCLVEMRKLL